MVTRVQLDASHVSRCVTVRREKAHRYIRDPNELLRYTRFRILLLRLRELEYAEREHCTWSTGRIIRRPPWGRVKPVPIHSVSSWSFLQFLCGCVLVQPFSAVHSSFCSVNSCFPPFVRVLFGEFEVPTVRLGFNR